MVGARDGHQTIFIFVWPGNPARYSHDSYQYFDDYSFPIWWGSFQVFPQYLRVSQQSIRISHRFILDIPYDETSTTLNILVAPPKGTVIGGDDFKSGKTKMNSY
jgi:hypothetical protein